MKASDVVLLVYDEKEHFEKNLHFLGETLFKDIKLVENLQQLDDKISKLDDNAFVFLAVHAFFTMEQKGIRAFLTSGIKEKYPLFDEMFISEGNGVKIKKELLDHDITLTKNISRYHHVATSIDKELVKVYTKKDMLERREKLGTTETDVAAIEYVVITALEEDEMAQVLPLIKSEGRIKNAVHNIEYGTFVDNPQKKVAFVSQHSTGMVDASILATEMILRFSPKYIIMTGVMGGKPDDTKIGDIIVSTKVFTIDKGKLSGSEFKREIEASNTDSAAISLFRRHKEQIERYIKDLNVTRNDNVSIHFEPVACVRQVIDVEGYFAEKISVNDRKTIGLEMESYGIARACELVNDKRTIPLIIKSVMDNTAQKTDGAKKYAAWTSAMFLKYIVANDLI
ncbi:hypothetical protein [Flavobacterium sp. HJSW_4]|uniref:5'-methylthioadenosine/S-adenosylhomocysteine nucleosidase family protein n=1 Tax=Flavobacterium sp. HJSW_4 TaxID=3344660 RepID=UPI0035F28A5D